jgi:hypothetical protein
LGDFQVTKVNGEVQKSGGNVVSYFLTPQGNVINAVVGPAQADKLLAEAKWAVDTWQQARERSKQNSFVQAGFVAQAHAAVSGDRTHQLLAENPLVPLPLIQQRVFEKLAGQKVSQNRSPVALAVAGFQRAEQHGLPVLLVLTKAQPKPGEWDAATGALLVCLNRPPISKAMRNCVLVLLPIDELPALSNLVDLSDLELAERTTPAMVLTKCDGTEIAALSTNSDPRDIARQLWDAVNHARLANADKLIETGKQREATTLLKLVKLSPQAGELRREAVARLADLKK